MSSPGRRGWKMIVWSMTLGSALLTSALVSTPRVGFVVERHAHAQSESEVANKSVAPTTIEEIRRLVRELEASIEGQRDQLKRTETSLRRVKVLLDDLERVRLGSSDNQDRPPVRRSPDPSSALPEKNLPEQELAERTPWSWPSETATAEACARGFGSGYEVEIEPKETFYKTIHIRKNGEDVVTWPGHFASVFIRGGDTLYYADFSPNAHGCSIVAYQLNSRRESWKTPLIGIGFLGGHSMYTNRVNMKLKGNRLIVYGDEAGGRYIEILDVMTGRTLGQRGGRGQTKL
jgi:hypothetical protein